MNKNKLKQALDAMEQRYIDEAFASFETPRSRRRYQKEKLLSLPWVRLSAACVCVAGLLTAVIVLPGIADYHRRHGSDSSMYPSGITDSSFPYDTTAAGGNEDGDTTSLHNTLDDLTDHSYDTINDVVTTTLPLAQSMITASTREDFAAIAPDKTYYGPIGDPLTIPEGYRLESITCRPENSRVTVTFTNPDILYSTYEDKLLNMFTVTTVRYDNAVTAQLALIRSYGSYVQMGMIGNSPFYANYKIGGEKPPRLCYELAYVVDEMYLVHIRMPITVNYDVMEYCSVSRWQTAAEEK